MTELDTSPCNRSFRIIDVFAVTTAVAVAIAGGRYTVDLLSLDGEQRVRVFITLTAMSVTWMLAILAVADTTRMADAGRSPGKLAVIVVACASILSFARIWSMGYGPSATILVRVAYVSVVTLFEADAAAYSVLAAWGTLALLRIRIGAWDWIGFSGMLLGLFWVGCAFGLLATIADSVLRIDGITLQ